MASPESPAGRRLRRELVALLLIKLLLLAGAWWLWFDRPLARHMRVPLPAVERQMLGTSPPESSTAGVVHDPPR